MKNQIFQILEWKKHYEDFPNDVDKKGKYDLAAIQDSFK